MHHVAVVLDRHEALDLDGPVLAHPPEVVAAEVDEHHVLGSLLGIGEQLFGDPAVLVGVLTARARARDRARRDPPAGDRDQRLRARAGDLEIAEVEEVHVRARIHRAQPAVDRERLDRNRPGPALRRHHLERVPGVDVLDDPRDVGLELLPAHVRVQRRHGPVVSRRSRRPRDRPGQPPANLGDRLLGARVRGVEIVVAVDVRDHRDRVLEVIERDQRVGQHQREVGQPDRIRVGRAERLNRADQVVGEQAHRATGERRQVGQGRDPQAAELGLGERVRIALVAERPAQHLARAKADERVAPDAPLVG